MEITQLYDQLQVLMKTYGYNLLFAGLILLIGWRVAKAISRSTRKLFEKKKIDATLTSFSSNLLYAVLLLFVIIAALNKLGVQTSSLVAILGAAGLTAGLALQGSLANFVSGILMIIIRPFKINDYIEGGGTAGIVEEIGTFTTTLKTPDNKKVIIPNTLLMGDNIVNYTAEKIRRLDLVIGVGYDDNIHEVKSALKEVLDAHDLVLSEPAYTVAIMEFGDSSVNFVVRPWVNTDNYWALYFDLHTLIKDKFDERHITIPYPQQDVYLHKIEEDKL